MLKLPFDPKNTKAVQKVYEADEELRYARITYIDECERLVVVDEPKFVKILRVDDTKLILEKDYFVDNYFSTYPDVNAIKGYNYCNKMLYSSNGGNILQEKGKHDEAKFYSLYYGQYSLDYSNTNFPLCTEDFILYSLSPEWNSSYTEQKQYLLLAPPMNSYRIKQRDLREEVNIEFFLPFDDKYVVYMRYAQSEYTYDVKSIELDIYTLNGEVIQTLKTPSDCGKQLYPFFSQSGEYMVVPHCKLHQNDDDYTSLPDNERKIFLKVFKIKPSDEFKRMTSSIDVANELQREMSNAGNRNIAQLEEFETYEIKDAKFDDGYYGIFSNYRDARDWSETQMIHVDNKGNVIFVNPDLQVFMINDKNCWDSFCKHKIDEFDWDKDENIFKIGQGTMVMKQDENIKIMRYNEYQVSSSKVIKHKALDIEGQ